MVDWQSNREFANGVKAEDIEETEKRKVSKIDCESQQNSDQGLAKTASQC